MKLVAMLQVYNELDSGNLHRCMMSLAKYCDAIQVYDDASTDGSPQFLLDVWEPWTRGRCSINGTDSSFRLEKLDMKIATKNDFSNELAHKQWQIDRCIEMGADWIWRIDADEVLEPAGEQNIRELCENESHASWAFHMVNLWRHPAYYRVDGSWNDVVFNRLWATSQPLRFDVVGGLHQTNYPIGATDNEGMAPFEVIHYGFASDEEIIKKYKTYQAHGQTGWALDRLIDETTLMVRPARPEWFNQFPEGAPSRHELFRQPIRKLI